MGAGNAVMGFDLTSFNTKLAIYYRYEKRVVSNVQKLDTTVTYFTFSGNCAAANFVKRDYSGTPTLASLNNGSAPDPILYLQNSPGTFANLKLSGLAGLSNRVIHRADS